MSDALTRSEPDVTDGRRLLWIDLASSYALSVARVASWAFVLMIVARRAGFEAMALVALIRGTLNLLAYIPSAVAPPLIRTYVESFAVPTAVPAVAEASNDAMLEYVASPLMAKPASDTGRTVVTLCGAMTLLAGFAYAFNMTAIHGAFRDQADARSAFQLAGLMILGHVIRVFGEPAGARLQACGLLWVDNVALVSAEILAAAMLAVARDTSEGATLSLLGVAIVLAQFAGFLIRCFADPRRRLPFAYRASVKTTLVAIGVIYLGQVADFLYAPTNQILIDRTLGRRALAAYVPCLQFDSALLLIVSGISVALFPRLARFYQSGDKSKLRQGYLRGSLVSLALLAAGAMIAWMTAPSAVSRWLGRIPEGTLALLPFVLLHTVIGGTAGVGRAVLLAMGRFRAYTISAVIGGVANVGLALLFVLGFGWGLRGVALATIVAVVARCAIWMPWYVLRATR